MKSSWLFFQGNLCTIKRKEGHAWIELCKAHAYIELEIEKNLMLLLLLDDKLGLAKTQLYDNDKHTTDTK